MHTPAAGPSDLQIWRLRILDRVLGWTAVIGLLPCLAGITLAVRYALWPVAVLDAVCWLLVVAVARSTWPYPFRAFTAIAVFAALGIGIFAATGPYGVGLLWLLAVPVLTGVLAPPKMMWVAQAAVLVSMCVVGSFVWMGTITWPGPPTPVLWWLMAWTSLLSISLMVGLSASTVMQQLQRSLDAAHDEQAALTKANAALEREIEARRRAEQERASMQKQLLLSQKMEAVGQLAGGFAHELNNALTVIRLEIALIEEGEARQADVTEPLGRARQATESAAALCARLLLFARRRQSQRVPVDIDETVIAFRPLLASLLGERSRLELALGAPGVCVQLDPVEIEQVLVNLVSNAKDAMPSGGRVALSTRQVADEHGQWLQIEIRDDGIGMDPEISARAFEPFFSTKPDGSGLGLSMVYAIVTDLGGMVSLDSAQDRGTCAQICLPIADAVVVPSAAPPSPRSPALPRRILVVDDQPMIGSAVKRVLARQGCEVTAVGSAQEALDWLQRSDALPDLLLTDVVMPKMTGVELAEQLRALHPELPILAMSGYLNERDFAARLSMLGIPLLDKPFAPDVLLRAVSERLSARYTPPQGSE